MHEGKLVFAQLIDHLPMHTFRRIVDRFDGESAEGFEELRDNWPIQSGNR